MANPEFLTDFLVVLITATAVAFSFEFLRLPAILGFLLAGVLIGPQGFGVLSDIEKINHLAELGVILLMLSIGLEFSFKRLKGAGRIAIVGGSLQILVSILIGLGFAAWRGWKPFEGFILGSVIALSSTAIVLKYLMDRRELDTHYGKIAFSILIFQDLAVMPLMIFSTGSGGAGQAVIHITAAAAKSLILVLGAVACSRFLLPPLFKRIAKTRNRELFFLAAVVISLGTAWLSGRLGLSLAIGAFFAGFMFANTDFGPQLSGEFVPFRHIFVSVFFVSIGLLFDLRFALSHLVLVLTMLGLVILVNFVVMTILVIMVGYPPRIAMATGLILSQIGEFSFLLIDTANRGGGINPQLYHLLLSTAFLSMLATPLLFAAVPFVFKISERIPWLGAPPGTWKGAGKMAGAMEGHVILCGFGPTGRDLSMTLFGERIPFVALEMNPQRVHEARENNVKVIYGDAANFEVMRKAGIERARAVIVSFADPVDIAQILRVVGNLNPRAFCMVRTRYEANMPRLYEFGADVVVMEEWEASHELNRALLHHFQVSEEKIQRHLERIRNRKELAVEEAILRRELKRGG